MSAIAGVLAVYEGAHHLLSPAGGRGLLLGGIPGLASGTVAAAHDHHPRLQTRMSTPETVAAAVAEADVVVGAVFVPGRRAPVVITRDMIHHMRYGSVVVDIAIDQGGCTEVSRPTTHTDPVFSEGPARLYCVANMPAAAGRTATDALTQATLPLIRDLASGIVPACQRNAILARAVNVAGGAIVHPAVAEALPDLPHDSVGLGLTTG